VPEGDRFLVDSVRDLPQRGTRLEARLIASRRKLGKDPVYLIRFGRPLGQVFAHRQGVLLPAGVDAGMELDGTTVMVAQALGRMRIGNDLRPDYCRAAYCRSFDLAQAAKTLPSCGPPPAPDLT
jgi:hypothetical protein